MESWKCYICHKDLTEKTARQMHFFGVVADYLGLPRSGVDFCSDCYKEILPKWKEAVRVTASQIYESALSACSGDNRPDPEPCE